MKNIIKRTGLRIRYHKVDNQVANHFKLFAKWLRKKFDFPVRVRVYLSEKKFVISKDGEQCISIFLAPYDNQIEPYIRIATGDYEDLICERGQEEAIFEILFPLALEIKRYIKWLSNNDDSLDRYDPTNDAEKLLHEFL
jgi:hypothetical protein